MSIATDIEVTWNGTVDNTNKIGLSKPFTELPSDVWADDSAFITAYDNPAAKFTKVSDGYPTCPVKSNDCPWYLTGGIGYSNINNNSDSIYLRSAIICVPDDFVYNTWNGNQGGRIRDNINNFRIVTSMSTVKNGVDVSLTVQDGTVVGAQYVLKETLTGSSSNGGITIGAGTYILMIVDIYTVDGNYYLNIPYSLPGFVYDTNNGDGVMGMWAYDSSVNKMFSLSPQIFPTDDGRISITGGAVYNVNTWNRHELPAVDGDENLIFCASYIPWNWYLSLSGNVHYHLLAVSRFGLKFKYNNDNYKPIITQGVVTGYTTDMTVPSDFDNWTDISGHNISPAPPAPTPSGDDAEPETFGWGGSEVAGMVRYYLLSQSEMEDLQAFMSDASWRMDYRNCIIGMYVVPNGGLFFDAAVPTTLKFRIGLNETGGAIPQDQELDTGISCLRITGVVNNDSAVIELPRINGNFLDFEPYSKYMVYVPFCGVIPLPDYVAGKEIKITIYPDVPTCTCTAVVSSEDRKIATAKGAYGSQLPVTSDGDGLKAASVINSLGNVLMGAGEVALGVGTGMVPLAIAGGAQMISSGLQTDLQLGQAFGYSIGASGDTSFFGAGNRCEYYVAYSKWNNPDVDEGELQTNIYGHTYGFVCNKRGLLKDFDGFTVCDNPHVYGFSCTSDEKDEIEMLLREGIIIHIHEE